MDRTAKAKLLKEELEALKVVPMTQTILMFELLNEALRTAHALADDIISEEDQKEAA